MQDIDCFTIEQKQFNHYFYRGPKNQLCTHVRKCYGKVNVRGRFAIEGATTIKVVFVTKCTIWKLSLSLSDL